MTSDIQFPKGVPSLPSGLITGCAIRVRSTGEILVGPSHPIIADRVAGSFDEEEFLAWNDNIEDGFLSDYGDFLTREEVADYLGFNGEIHSGHIIALNLREVDTSPCEGDRDVTAAQIVSGSRLASSVQGRVEVRGITSLGTADINFPRCPHETPAGHAANGDTAGAKEGAEGFLSIIYEGNVRIPDIMCAVCLNFHRYAPACPECGHLQAVTE